MLQDIINLSHCTEHEAMECMEVIQDVLPMSNEGKSLLRKTFKRQVEFALRVVRL